MIYLDIFWTLSQILTLTLSFKAFESSGIAMAPKKGGKMEAFPTNWLQLSKVPYDLLIFSDGKRWEIIIGEEELCRGNQRRATTNVACYDVAF
jgi:hypothetical protein